MKLRRVLLLADRRGPTESLFRSARSITPRPEALHCLDILPPLDRDLVRALGAEDARALEEERTTERVEQLTAQCAAAFGDAPPPTVEVRSGDPYTEVLTTLREQKFDVLLKNAAHTDERLPIEAKLSRHAPIPFWLVGSETRWPPRILVAIVPDPDHDPRHRLCQQTLRAAFAVKAATGGSVEAVHAYAPNADSVLGARYGPSQIATLLNDVAAAKTRRVEEALVEAGAAPGACPIHVRAGKSSEVIRRVAKEQQADVIVIGRVGRGRLHGLLIGNTTEAVFTKTRRSIVIVPAG